MSKSRDIVRLSGGEMARVDLETRVSIHKELKESGRLKKMGRRITRKVSIKKIAEKRNTSIKTVYRYEKRYEGIDSPDYTKENWGSGRPLLLNDEELCKLMDVFVDSDTLWSLGRLREQLKNMTTAGSHLDDRVLLRILARMGIVLKKYKESTSKVSTLKQMEDEAQCENAIVYHVSRGVTVRRTCNGNDSSAVNKKTKPREYHLVYMVSRSGIKHSFFSVARRRSSKRLLEYFKQLSGNIPNRIIYIITQLSHRHNRW